MRHKSLKRTLIRCIVLFSGFIAISELSRANVGIKPERNEPLFQQYLEKIEVRENNFEKFVNRLVDAATHIEQEMPVYFLSAVAPRGRSLQKDRVRQLRAIVFSRGFTFIGYADSSDKGEVISWNPRASQYDFLEFSGLQSKHFKLQNANRDLCLSCHQNEGPIFPRAPWMELVEEKSFAKFGGTDRDLLPLSPKDREEKRFLNHKFFDLAVRQANLVTQVTKSCNEMCGKSIECRKQLLLAALSFHNKKKRQIELKRFLTSIQRGRAPMPTLPSSDVNKQVLDKLQSILSPRWPESEFAILSSTLPDRSAVEDFPGFKVIGKLRNGEDPNYSDGFSQISTRPVNNNVDPEVIERITSFQISQYTDDSIKETKLTEEEGKLADPKTPRPLVNRIPKAYAGQWALTIAADCFSLKDSDLPSMVNIPTEKLVRGITRNEISRSLCQWPPSKAAVLLAVKHSLSGRADISEKDAICGREQNWRLIAEKEKAASGSVKTSLEGFQKYCFKCHNKDSIYPLELNDLSFMKSYKGFYGSIKEALEKKQMPPATSPQPSESELKMMLTDLTR